MKIFILLFALTITSSSYLLREKNKSQLPDALSSVAEKKALAIGCSPDLTLVNFSDPVNAIPLLSGWGDYRMPVTSSNDSALIYFQQGINMYYGFHIIESVASFEKAIQFDKNFAMAFWGKSLAYGPNINDLGYTASPEALLAMKKAQELSAVCTPVEKALIGAMQVRYSQDTTLSRELLNRQYATAMKAVHEQFTESQDAAALYADALMVEHPWDFYDYTGKPKTWTPEIVNTLEAILKKNSKHPGAAHYYIHAIEASRHPEKGVMIARQLPSLMPGVAHLVHMPSHIFIRSGYYDEGVQVNEFAVKSYNNYLNNYAPVVGNSFLYAVHNLHMQAACANMDGRFAEAMKTSLECRNSFDSSLLDMGGYLGAYAQYIYMTPLFTQIRFGKWDDILSLPEVPESRVYANLLWHFGRGISFARKHDILKAQSELIKLQGNMQNQQMMEHPPAFNAAIAGAGVAEKILAGIIAEENNDIGQSISLLDVAKKMEDEMLYNEPKDWLLPVRQYLGAALMKAGRYKEAYKILKEDLQQNPRNGWALTGLAASLMQQNKQTESIRIQEQARKALERADVQIAAPVF